MFIVLAGSATAGSQTDPEIMDVGEPDESDGGEDDDDIRWAWFSPENGTHLNCTLELYTLPPFQTGLRTLEYEIYFTAGSTDYSVVSIFDYGTGWTQAGYELRTVQYDNGNVTGETQVSIIEGDYSTNDGTIMYYIPKSDIGVAPADILSHTWAGVWTTPIAGDRELSDEARNYTSPGRNYNMIGLGLPDQDLVNDGILPGNKTVFSIEVGNPGEVEITAIVNNTYDHDWVLTVAVDAEAKTVPEFEITVLQNSTLIIYAILEVPEDPETDGLESINDTPALSFKFIISYSLFNGTVNITRDIVMIALIDVTGDVPSPNGDDDDDDDNPFPAFEAVLVALAVPSAIVLTRRRLR